MNDIRKQYLQNIDARIEAQALDGVLHSLPSEGELISYRGGIGNRILKEVTKRNGQYFERNDPNDEWKESNVMYRILDHINKMGK